MGLSELHLLELATSGSNFLVAPCYPLSHPPNLNPENIESYKPLVLHCLLFKEVRGVKGRLGCVTRLGKAWPGGE